MDEKGNIIGSVNSENLIVGILKWKKEIWKNLYSHNLREIASPVKIFSHNDMLSDYFSYLATSKYSYAVFMNDSVPYLITPFTLLQFMYDHDLIKDIVPKTYASRLISANESIKLLELLELMISKWIRKVAIGGKLITDRRLAECYLFTMHSLGSLSKDPDNVLNISISEMNGCLLQPPAFSDGEDAKSIARKILSSDAHACVSDELILTPYDLAIKPFIKNRH